VPGETLMSRGLSAGQLPDAGARAAALFGFWLILTGANPADMVVGVFAAGAATWVSLRLLPAGTGHPRPLALLAMVLRLAREAVRAGVDVAWRALDPRLPVQPGFVSHRLNLPPGLPRDAFGALASLMPGTVAAGREKEDQLIVHCLDMRQPVMAQLAADEARLAKVLGVRDDV
jgi:multicomponent Na+:H+ antiporter subunit E